MSASYAIGIDIGGTFTDCAVLEEQSGVVTVTKSLTTPHNPSEGFFNVLDAIAEKLGLGTAEMLGRTSRIVHGTTRGTNAIVARHGATIGLMTTSGHSDVIRIQKGGGRTRGIASDIILHMPETGKPAPIVPKRMTVEIAERIDKDGDILMPISRESVLAGLRKLLDQGADSIAISFLWSVRNPVHEEMAKAWIKEEAPDLFVSVAHELVASVGEFSRTMTAVMNAYIGPLMVEYVRAIEAGVEARGYAGRVLFTQCAGGAITGTEVRHAPIQTLQSGPVSGILASAYLGSQTDHPNILTADIGGTTLDVGIIDGGQPLTRTRSIFERFELALPMLDLDSIGAGGGSIAWLDESGRLQVGPRSAGAYPGPACFGRGGTEPTVTDADVVLGIIDPAKFLHGKMTLDVAAAEAAIARVAGPLGLTIKQAAAGINRLVDTHMGALMRRMSLLRGYDPRDFVCYAFGGAGPPHAGAIAREAGASKVVVPLLNVSTAWSAFGAAASDIVHVFQAPKRLALPVAGSEIAATFADLLARAKATLESYSLDFTKVRTQFGVRMKYSVQVHDLSVEVDPARLGDDASAELERLFGAAYDRQYGKGAGFSAGGTQITSFELRVTSPVAKPRLAKRPLSSVAPKTGSRLIYWDELGGEIDTPVIDIDEDLPGGPLHGPLVIDLPDTVIVVRPGQVAHFDELGSLVIDVAAEPAPTTTRGGQDHARLELHTS